MVYRILAISKLCEHLADADEELTEADLEERLDPKEKQKIYLVAAGYEPDVLSACAWLRGHDIDIACFQLRPYKVSDQLLLERERLIPPPQLDDFLVEMRPSADGTSTKRAGSIERRKADKPSLVKWDEDAENQQALYSWKEVLVEATKKALKLGLAPDALPMTHSGDGEELRSPSEVQPNLHIETHANAELIRLWLSKMFRKIEKPKGFLRIVTQAGKTFDLPEDAQDIQAESAGFENNTPQPNR